MVSYETKNDPSKRLPTNCAAAAHSLLTLLELCTVGFRSSSEKKNERHEACAHFFWAWHDIWEQVDTNSAWHHWFLALWRPAVQWIFSKVDMVVAIQDHLLTQWRHMPMGKFRANIFLIRITSTYFWASEVFKNRSSKSWLFWLSGWNIWKTLVN